jgi:hypothetical protein
MAQQAESGRVPARAWTHKAMWLIGLGLLANAGAMLYTHFAGRAPALELGSTAFAQAAPGGQMLGARGIYMMPAQLGPQVYGLYLMDIDSETITVYRANPDNSRLHLMAARSFKNDRFLQDYNNDKPTPGDVQKLVAQQRERTELEKKTTEPTVSQEPKADENKPDALRENP